MRPDDPRHGTYAGYLAHKVAYREDACFDCLRANTRYHQQQRKTNPKRRDYERRYSTARGLALERLAAMHPRQFRVLLDEELAK